MTAPPAPLPPSLPKPPEKAHVKEAQGTFDGTSPATKQVIDAFVKENQDLKKLLDEAYETVHQANLEIEERERQFHGRGQ